MRLASQAMAQKIIPNGDGHLWVTYYDAVSGYTETDGTRSGYTVHLNDDGTTSLYYTGA